ncbi:MAG: hypothetical protein ABIA91_02565 [Patescibacteria group bacterium]
MKILRIFLILIILVALIWLFVLDFVPGEKLEINYDFCNKESMITELSPGDRLWPIKKVNNECFQDIAASPVYFDIRVPQYFNSAEIEVKYIKPDNEEFKIGPQVKKDEWIWMLEDIQEIEKNGESKIGKAEFNLENIYQNSSVMRWLISASTVEENKQVISISNIKIVLYKDRLSVDNLLQQIKSYVKKIIR